MSFRFHDAHLPGVLLLLLFVAACQRESRHFRVVEPATHAAEAGPASTLQPGPAASKEGTNPAGVVPARYPDEYDSNAWEIAQGQRLFIWMNCTGCHAHGGGAIGPPLMDAGWIYGAKPEDIYASIVEGRPNGMPSYRGRLNNHQAWQLVAYVRSLSGHVRKDAAPGRTDGMHVKQRELAKETEPVVRETRP